MILRKKSPRNQSLITRRYPLIRVRLHISPLNRLIRGLSHQKTTRALILSGSSRRGQSEPLADGLGKTRNKDVAEKGRDPHVQLHVKHVRQNS